MFVYFFRLVSGVITTDPPDQDIIDAFNLEGDDGYIGIPVYGNGTCGKAVSRIIRVENNTIASYGIYNKEGKKSSFYILHIHASHSDCGE